jgi:hypothetical protein
LLLLLLQCLGTVRMLVALMNDEQTHTQEPEEEEEEPFVYVCVWVMSFPKPLTACWSQ